MSPDITMCKGTNCPVSTKCHRFMAKADKYQSYFVDVPGETKDGKFTCDYFWGEQAQDIWNQLNDIVNGKADLGDKPQEGS